MARLLARRLTFANVMSVIAVFIALGGTAFAFSLGKNSVGSKQIKPNAITASELKKNAVTGAKIKNNAVTSAKIAANSVNGGKVKDGTIGAGDLSPDVLSNVPASNVISVSMEGDCTLRKAVTGVTTDHPGTGICRITYPKDVSACDATASVDLRLGANQVFPAAPRTAFTARSVTTPTVIATRAYYDDPPALNNLPVTVTLVC